MNKKLIFNYKGETFLLNEDLLNKNDSWENVEKIKELHRKRIDLFKEAKKNKSKKRLKTIGWKVEKLEFQLQSAWKFPRSRDFHCYWFLIPNCTCPKIDNTDYFGTKYRAYSMNCPIHGDRCKK